MIESLLGFTLGFLLACGIFRTRRPSETMEQTKAAAAKRYHALALKMLKTPWAPEYNSDREVRIKSAERAMAEARRLESEVQK